LLSGTILGRFGDGVAPDAGLRGTPRLVGFEDSGHSDGGPLARADDEDVFAERTLDLVAEMVLGEA